MKYLPRLILLTTILISTGAWGDESPFKISVETLVAKTTNTGDVSYLGIASLRCAALMNTYLTLVELNMDIENDGTVASTHQRFGIYIQTLKMKENGAKQSYIAMIPEKANADVQRDSLKYWEWLKSNKESTGDYVGSSPTFQKEIEQCKAIYYSVPSDPNDQ